MIITGSTAARYWNMNMAIPKDMDCIHTALEKPLVHSDSHIVPQDIYDAILQYTENSFLTMDALYTLKCSHLQWDIKWSKTKKDIIHYKRKGCNIIPPLYNILVEYWKTIHGDKDFLSLDKSKEEFFTDTVYYPMDHDELHEKVAFPDKPMYIHCLKDGQDVLIDKYKFDILSEENKLQLFQEEIHVISLERYLLNPSSKINSPIEAYLLALKKTITNLTKGWASTWIITNLELFTIDMTLITKVIPMSPKSDSEQRFINKIMEETNKKANKYSYIDSAEEYLVDLALGNYPDDDIKVVEQEGGGEGGAEYCWAILNFNDQYFRVVFYYYSYDGYSTDDLMKSIKEVYPKSKVVTVYE